LRIGIDASNIRSGGGLTHLTQLLSAGSPRNHSINEVVIWASQYSLSHLPDRPWLRRVHEPGLDGPAAYRLKWQKFSLGRLASEACDLLFVPGGIALHSFYPYVALSQNMLPFDAKEAGRYRSPKMVARLRLLRHLQKKTFEDATGVIYLHDYARQTIEGQLSHSPSTSAIVPHGIEDRFRLAPRTQIPFHKYSRSRPFRFLSVSIVNLYNHQEGIAQAIARLRRRGFPIVLDIVGPGYRPAIKRLRTTMERLDPMQDFIRHLGPVPFNKIHDTYHAADAFVFASTCENLPNILIEAMAAGLPIACSHRPPMPDVLHDAGFYFDPEDPYQLELVLEELLLRPDLRERHAQRAAEIANTYSWDRSAFLTYSFMSEVARGFLE
jgi:glycosyltransferase involved in cell wall biosynthesis